MTTSHLTRRFGARRLTPLCLAIGIVGATFGSAPASASFLVEGDPVRYWSNLVSTTLGPPPPPPLAARTIAMAQVAIYEAANLTTGKVNKSYLGLDAQVGETRAAIAVAARNVLVAINPGQTAVYDNALAASLALIPDSQAKTDGIAAGNTIAAAVIANRLNDGANLVVPYTPQAPGTPGAWQPVPPGSVPPIGPQLQNMQPWMLTSVDQFLAPPPPALNSMAYAAAFNEVKSVGSFASLARTADQTNSALVWASTGAGLTWQNIAMELAQQNGMSPTETARLLATLAISNADTFLAVWDSKYHYDYWRPYTAIRNADTDGNGATDVDPAWTSRIGNPNYPSHSSGLSGNSGSATTILASFFGENTHFCVTGTAGQRCFDSFSAAAQDSADSRIYGGIHFRFETEAGLAQGRSVANLVLANSLAPVPEPQTWAMLILGFGMVGAGMRSRKTIGMRLHKC